MSSFLMDSRGLDTLISLLHADGYTVIGPVLVDGVIHYSEIHASRDLPAGISESQEPGKYSVKKTGENRFFGFNNGPDSLKKYFYPAEKLLFKVVKSPDRPIEFQPEAPAAVKYAFIGVRSCELKALQIHDKVFMDGSYQDDYYSGIRKNSLIISVNCTVSAATCFCASMDTGPAVKDGDDINLTEFKSDGRWEIIAKGSSERGRALLARISLPLATDALTGESAKQVSAAGASQSRKVDFQAVRENLRSGFSSDIWDKVAESCLHCSNCTMVCPTCFCSTIEDETDLGGGTATRTRKWDSCFREDFSYIHGGKIRTSGKSRYRQWLSHKFTNWFDQFGSSGCVGCGRCISWCPAGIDITSSANVFTGGKPK